MAIVNALKRHEARNTRHTQAECTYSVILNDGKKWLQIDTYGSKDRQRVGKKSQSIRFTTEAIDALKKILEVDFSPRKSS